MGGTAVAIGLGSNRGDRWAHLQAGIDLLAARSWLRPTAVSPVYETAYVGPGPAQRDYLNAVLLAECDRRPDALLDALQEAERERGRRPGTHLRPRPLDCDLLLFGDRRVRSDRLVVPHPELARRAFVLEPLAAVAPDWTVPDCGLTVGELCAIIRRDGTQRLRPWPGSLRLPAAGGKELP